MTMPDERKRSVLQAREFLLELNDVKKYLGVPEAVRKEPYRQLRHYPSAFHLNSAHRGEPSLWGLALGEIDTSCKENRQ